MKVLVVGSGGREHALCWKIAQSARVEEVLALPGNPGTAGVGRNVEGADPEDVAGVVRVAKDEGLHLFLDHVCKLPREDRMILIHCGLEGLTHAETSTRLGLSRDAVAKRWQRLRAKLEQEKLPRELFLDA